MGQYYKFINTTKQLESTIPLPFNFRMPWAKSLEACSQDDLKQKFDYVRKNNNWSETDEVIAMGDYGNIVYCPKD